MFFGTGRFFVICFPRGANRWSTIARSDSEDEVYERLSEWLTDRDEWERGHWMNGELPDDMRPDEFEAFILELPVPIPGKGMDEW